MRSSCCLKRIAVGTGLYKILRYLNKEHVIILMYHGFFKEAEPEGVERYANRWCGIEAFERQAYHLHREYNVISLERLIDHYTQGAPIPERAVVVTMDEGYESCYSLAYPVLRRYEMPATIFLSVDFVENQEPLWADRLEYTIWKSQGSRLRVTIGGKSGLYEISDEERKCQSVSQIRSVLWRLPYTEIDVLLHEIESDTGHALCTSSNPPLLQRPLQAYQLIEMTASGLVAMGSHSLRHPNLVVCSDRELEEEVLESRYRIERRLGKECSLFCYPGGRFDSRVKQYVKNAGYSCGLATKGRFERVGNADRYELARVGVGRTMSTTDFVFTVCDVRRRQGRTGNVR